MTKHQDKSLDFVAHEAASLIESAPDLEATCRHALVALANGLDATYVHLTIDHAYSRSILGPQIQQEGTALPSDQDTTHVRRVGIFGSLEIRIREEAHDAHLLQLLSQQLEDAWQTCLQTAELERTHADLINRRELDRRIGRSLAHVTSTKELAVTIDGLLETIFQTEHTAFYFIHPESGELTLGFAKDFEDWEIEDAERTAWHRHPGLVIRTGRVLDIPDTDADPEHLTSTSLRRHAIKSRLYLPVHFGDQVIGAIGLAATKTHAFNEKHRDALQFLTDIAGLTWGRLREEKTRERRERLLYATSEITSRLLATPDWRSTLPHVLQTLAQSAGVQSAALVEFGTQADIQSLIAHWPSSMNAESALRFASIHMESILKGKVAWNDEEKQGRVEAWEKFKNVMVGIPIHIGTTTRGMIVVEGPGTPNGWDDSTLEAIRTVASAIAAADSRSRLESALRHSQKLEAIGTLAGGIAHDFNNLLWPILTYTQLLQEREQDKSNHEMLNDIENATKRASDLVRQILDLSRHMEPRREIITMRSVVDEALGFLRRSLPIAISLNEDLQEVGTANVDASGIHQIILNLCTNACQAMPSGGTINVSLARIEDNKSELVIEDNGPGMDEHTLLHMFDPYFTTKIHTGGTGLGMVIVRRIVEELGGAIDVSSTLGSGTRVAVTIPVSDMQLPQEQTQSTDEYHARTAGMRVLIVDDDPFVGAMCADLLESFGYEVERFEQATNLLERATEGIEELAAIVTDLAMPGMSGIDLTRALRSIDQEIPIICCTGFGSDALEREAMNAGVTHFARKPLDLEEFGRIMSEATASRTCSPTKKMSTK